MNWDATIHTYIFTQSHTLSIHPLIRASRYPQNVIKNHKDINILIGSERMFLLIFVQSFRNVSTLTVFTHTHPRTYTKHDMSILDHSSVHPFTHSPNRPFNHVWWRQTTYIHIHTSGAVKRCRQWSSLVFTFVQDKQMSYTVMYIFIFTPNGMYLYHRFRTKKNQDKKISICTSISSGPRYGWGGHPYSFHSIVHSLKWWDLILSELMRTRYSHTSTCIQPHILTCIYKYLDRSWWNFWQYFLLCPFIYEQ